MKATNYLLLSSSVILLFASCNNDVPTPPQIIEYNAYNMVYSKDALSESEPEITPCNYFVKFNTDNATMELKSNNFVINGKTFTLTTPEKSFVVLAGNNFPVFFSQPNTATLTGVTDNNMNATDVNCVILNRPFSMLPVIPGIDDGIYNENNSMKNLFFDCTTGNDLYVRSFNSDTYYSGITTTEFEYRGTPSVFEDENGGYRAILDIESKKATIIFYNVKFAQQAPSTTLVLENLDLEFKSGSYTIKGENIVSKMLEANGLTEYEARPFIKFELKTTQNTLNNVEIIYEVQDTKLNLLYKGRFEGSAYKGE